MSDERQQLHKMVDELPDDALQCAERALRYCANLGVTRLTIQRAQERVRALSMKRLEEHSKRIGHGLITSVGSGSGATMPDGDFNSFMIAWDDGPLTYHLRRFSGVQFEMYERLELAKHGTELVLTQRIVGPKGTEQLLTANIAVLDSAGGP
jgi:hypothetical protein